jgi:hypothetical protein
MEKNDLAKMANEKKRLRLDGGQGQKCSNRHESEKSEKIIHLSSGYCLIEMMSRHGHSD